VARSEDSLLTLRIDSAISERKILNSKHQIQKEIQKSKFKITGQKAKNLTFALSFCIFICFLHFEGICLEIGFWNLDNEIATPSTCSDTEDYYSVLQT
jgi:hypothetical protein